MTCAVCLRHGDGWVETFVHGIVRGSFVVPMLFASASRVCSRGVRVFFWVFVS